MQLALVVGRPFSSSGPVPVAEYVTIAPPGPVASLVMSPGRFGGGGGVVAGSYTVTLNVPVDVF